MPNEDTIQLLKECNAGTKMAVATIQGILTHVKSSELSDLLENSMKAHEAIGNRSHEFLMKYQDKDKEPNPIAKAMSWLETNIKLLINEKDSKIAQLVMDGCNAGIQSVSRYVNQYVAAREEAKSLAEELVKVEQELMNALRKFL